MFSKTLVTVSGCVADIGTGRTRVNSVSFNKNEVKIGAFPTTPTKKIWKTLPVDQKDQRRRIVWVGQACQLCVYSRKLMNSMP